jgi:hypothetical protein
MATAQVPDFLTVEEAGRVLRIGRTTAYQQAHLWLDTASEGLPVTRVGGSLRVPLAQFEQHYNIRVTAIPPPSKRRPATASTEPRSSAQDIPRSTRPAGRRKGRETAQGGLPFAG